MAKNNNLLSNITKTNKQLINQLNETKKAKCNKKASSNSKHAD